MPTNNIAGPQQRITSSIFFRYLSLQKRANGGDKLPAGWPQQVSDIVSTGANPGLSLHIQESWTASLIVGRPARVRRPHHLAYRHARARLGRLSRRLAVLDRNHRAQNPPIAESLLCPGQTCVGTSKGVAKTRCPIPSSRRAESEDW